MSCNILNCYTLHYITLNCPTQHFTTLHCITLHCTALHCTTLPEHTELDIVKHWVSDLDGLKQEHIRKNIYNGVKYLAHVFANIYTTVKTVPHMGNTESLNRCG